MDLPTYTSIWRIEKRLYKLYDFRLPMPVPVGQIAVFAAITVPYVILLTILGLPFNHTLFWLYVLPPGVITWLATRPVLESKRLPELVISQVRYLGEPGTWCRMAPLQEKDDVVVIGKVWRRDAERPRSPAEAPALAPAAIPAVPAVAGRPARLRPAAARKAAVQAAPASGAPASPRVRVPRAAPARPVPPAAKRRGRPPSGPLSPLVPQGRRLPRRRIRRRPRLPTTSGRPHCAPQPNPPAVTPPGLPSRPAHPGFPAGARKGPPGRPVPMTLRPGPGRRLRPGRRRWRPGR